LLTSSANVVANRHSSCVEVVLPCARACTNRKAGKRAKMRTSNTTENKCRNQNLTISNAAMRTISIEIQSHPRAGLKVKRNRFHASSALVTGTGRWYHGKEPDEALRCQCAGKVCIVDGISY